MAVSEYDLRRNYESKSTAELLELPGRGNLTEDATRMLQKILDERGVTQEERENGASAARRLAEQTAAVPDPLAGLGARLAAQTIDGLVAFAILIACILILPKGSNGLVGGGILLFLAYLLLADGLPGGQSLGKRVLGIAVLNEKTRKPCTLWGSFVRNLPLAILGIFDWIFILGAQQKRLGDMFAGTIVVKV
jgi:uncharacterized RDD family membrane protein YckC